MLLILLVDMRLYMKIEERHQRMKKQYRPDEHQDAFGD
jgi:hypothetical protein